MAEDSNRNQNPEEGDTDANPTTEAKLRTPGPYKNVIKNKKKVIKQYLIEKDFAVKVRQVKINNWIKNEEGYNGVVHRTLLTRSNLHVPVVFEGVQNMSSKLGAAADLKYDTVPEGDENASDIMQHVVKEDLKDSHWDQVFEDSKIEAGIYGRTVYKVIPGNDKQRIQLVDTLSYLISPIAKDTEHALYQGEQFIYKTLEQLYEEADEMEYDTEELARLKENKVPNDTQTDSSTEASLKNLRMANMGLANVTQYGSKVAELTEWVTYLKGKGNKRDLYHLTVANDRYLIRCKKSKDLGLKRPNYVSWGTYTRGITFWCPSVADVYRDPNLAIDVNMNQAMDNNTYRNFAMVYASSSSGLKQSSIVPRPLGVTVVQTGPNEKVQDKIYQPEIPEVTSALTMMTQVKGFADNASGLNATPPPGKSGKTSATQQAKIAMELDVKIQKMKKNATMACEELYQLVADLEADLLTKPRKVKIFGYKNLTIEGVTKKNFNDVKLVAKASAAEESQDNKAIKQKAKLSLYELFKDDPMIPGQVAMRRSVAKTFDIDPSEIEAWFTKEDQGQGTPESEPPPVAPPGAAPAAPGTPPPPPGGAPPAPAGNTPPAGPATAILGQTGAAAAATVPPKING